MKTKIFDATCVGNVVKVAGHTVAATILTQGTIASTGIVIMEGDKMTYVAANSTDLANVIDQVHALLVSIKAILSTLDGGTVVPGAAAAAITALTSPLSTLSSKKENLK